MQNVTFNIPPKTGAELSYIEKAIESNKICGDGEFTKKCSQWMENAFSAKKVLLTTSGTSALEMAAILCDIKPGDEVILPSYTFCSTADAFVQRGAKLVFVDVRPDTMNMDRLFLFIKMFFYAVFGQQKRFCKKLIASYIDKLNFDTAVVLTDVGFISGLFLTLGKEKQVVILEDGMGDYMERKYSNIFSHFHNFFDVQGFFLSLLGYSNIGHCFPLRTTKYCEKYCSHPDKMKYKNYKELKTLFETENTDNELFRKLLNIIYPNLSSIFNQKYDAILFTTPLTDYVHNDGKYVNKIVTYINNNFNSVLLKKHPRDSVNYHFNENIQSVEIDQTIPAEVLLPYLDGIKLFFCEHSSTNLYLLSFHYSPQYFYFTDLKNDNLKEKNILCQYKDENSFREGLAFFELPLNIIKL